MADKPYVVKRYITKSGTICDHLDYYSKNGDGNKEPNVLIMKKKDKYYKFKNWVYLPKKTLEKYNGQNLSLELGERLLVEEKGKDHRSRYGKILFKDENNKFCLTSIVEHIHRQKGSDDLVIEPEEKTKSGSTEIKIAPDKN